MKYAHQHTTRHRQRGQASLWFLAMMAACCASLALVYNVGQVTNEKEKTINAADAAALSGALVEARVLNFDAYANRAIIANEVTVAQLMSAKSFVDYDETMAYWLKTYVYYIPIVGEYVGPILETYEMIVDEVKTGLDYTANYAIQGIDIVVDALKFAQSAANFAAPLAADNLAKDIAEANATEVSTSLRAVSFVINTREWSEFTAEKDNQSDVREVMRKSLDQFSKQRGLGPVVRFGNTLMEYSSFGILPYINFDRTSDNTKITDDDQIVAQDSLDPYVTYWEYKFPFSFRKKHKYVPLVPIAYGRAEANSDSSNSGTNLCHPRYSSGSTTNCYYAVDSSSTYSWNGTPKILELKNPGGPTKKDPTLAFVVGVQKAGAATLTTQRLGSPQLQDNLQNSDHLTSLSTAEIYFARPDWNSRDITAGKLFRADRKHEYASLYNPYWQARLKPTDTGTRGLYFALIGANPLLSTFTP